MLGHLPRSNTIQYNTIQYLTSFLVALATMQCPARLQYTISSFHQYKTEPNLQYFILKSRFVVFLEITYKKSPSATSFHNVCQYFANEILSLCKVLQISWCQHIDKKMQFESSVYCYCYWYCYCCWYCNPIVHYATRLIRSHTTRKKEKPTKMCLDRHYCCQSSNSIKVICLIDHFVAVFDIAMQISILGIINFLKAITQSI